MYACKLEATDAMYSEKDLVLVSENGIGPEYVSEQGLLLLPLGCDH